MVIHQLVCDSNGFAPDYILGYQERDWYPLDVKWLLGKLQNKYYHLCIIQRCPLYAFQADMITVKSNNPNIHKRDSVLGVWSPNVTDKCTFTTLQGICTDLIHAHV